MNKEYCIDLKALPSLFTLYRKIFFGRKPGWDEQPLPMIKVSSENVTLSQDKVAQYAKVCGFDFDGKTLPLTYLYVMAFRLHAVIFTHDAITFPLLGMIHLKNSITLHRSARVDEEFNIQCALTDSRITDSGLEFELVSKVYVAGELVWESVSTYLYRIEGKAKRVRPPKANDMAWQDPVSWSLAEDLGRRYAKASGDYNLIHLHPVMSKRFGFDRVLAHGMWSKGRCIAQLMPTIGERACQVDVAFKLPLFMPNNVSFAAEQLEDKTVFELRDQKGRRPHLSGEITFL
ncbi:MaoC family dehydratase N-terminal domain-containing protein [Shewanella schlegeliana]|uniref:MaoC family dehydratase N-terminal domain-containing protein n=1 Tax=Shewanella schlegeliana TaxID=190308 RepID=A0ABS1SWQ0_9GAMM|nr:MaoC/PaaZ C-terminal domain-containing protein [Shewanella schlegeliana]MBL4912971.1 MaoC family dehydratase N-terminal domain-containing protein [Shewanella schlegeliana]MCL1108933.1 MaoC family dehydratase N-terminal domain-containing protein [Shewanella schlegeliana]